MDHATDDRSCCPFFSTECRPYCEPVLIDACLLRIPCRWHGGRPEKRVRLIERLQKRCVLVPVCPEQIGGMPTPRTNETLQGTGAQTLDEGLRRFSRGHCHKSF